MRPATLISATLTTCPCARHRRLARHRHRLTGFPASSNLGCSFRDAGCFSHGCGPGGNRTVFCISNYTVGDENCLYLYGPSDLRY